MATNNFIQDLEELKKLYEKLNNENKLKLEEAILMIITKFKNRL
ncbi:hypothetical protein SAMN02745883_00394 [Caminicella sporogenes DSM 14501]|uniref:Uncharacterized protein n=1 Tax=Caminicella sporogenes DSM 14501 TaxID=1121266 RepID=A0A1M6LY91_9FIRM|nr:hypothetical protein [Caminicella sporogenes]WIF94402.1 hypothetical protein QNI18_09020 [Caminicella sporogenes]SHJ76142.1 hypothetical protein SAMN02745883_00394 [Caminicella sporogenes DSM 14501]